MFSSHPNKIFAQFDGPNVRNFRRFLPRYQGLAISRVAAVGSPIAAMVRLETAPMP
jgi:hypothetical protein